MRPIFLFLFCILLTINLNARMNPFEPTDTFNEKKAEYFKKIEAQKQKELEEQRKKQEELLQAQKAQEEKLAREAAEAERKRLAQLAKIQEEKQKILKLKKEQEEAKKMAEKKAKMKALKAKTYKALPFVKFEVAKDTLNIYVDKKYKLIHKDILKKQKKMLFDFGAKKSFYTYRKNIKNKNFKGFAVGNHPKGRYFRVVVDLVQNTSKYTQKINSKKGMIVIKRK